MFYLLERRKIQFSTPRAAISSIKIEVITNYPTVQILPYPLLDILERALRALASSSGGAACPGGTWGQPRGSTPGVRE